MGDNNTFRLNNFDLLRLVAALQVVINHVIEIMQVHPDGAGAALLRLTYIFPGVPVFFFISGFLISRSYESNHRLSEYFQNRVLRLYPALIVCVAFSYVLIYLSGYMRSVDADWDSWLVLFLAKISFLQFYNPDFMRGYGDGVLNGSLWTITVELQFYLLVPLLYTLLGSIDSRTGNCRLIMLIMVFLILNRIYTYIPSEFHEEVWYKLLRVSFMPWFYMFLVGVFVQKNFIFFYRLFAGRVLVVFAVYVVVGYAAMKSGVPLGNNINPIIFSGLAIFVFSFAYSLPQLSKTLLRGNDISYGVYIYHMPIINFFLYLGYGGQVSAALSVFTLTVIVAWISWIYVERKSLGLKKHPLNPLNTAGDKKGA